MTKATLTPQPTVSELQDFIAKRLKERGLDHYTTQDYMMLLVEEVGELAKALRPLQGIKMASDAKRQNIEHEAADVIWMLMCVCNSLDIDLETAIRSKDAKNSLRTWN